MERFKTLDYRQKWIFLIMGVMVLVFSILYPVTFSRVGYSYRDAILAPHEADGTTVYSGKIQGEAASFTVTPDKSVTFQYGDTIYGPYTVTEDPSAVSPSHAGDDVLGVVVRQGEEILFRGSAQENEDYWFLYTPDGEPLGSDFTVTLGNGMVLDESGDVVDPMEPSLSVILDLYSGPELTHKGGWLPWIGGIILCVLNAVSILFADELFRFNLSFQIQDPELAEPSGWEIMSRYIGWGAVTIAALAIFIVGLS